MSQQDVVKAAQKAWMTALIMQDPVPCTFRGVAILARWVDQDLAKTVTVDGVEYQNSNTLWIVAEDAAGKGKPQSLEKIIVDGKNYVIQIPKGHGHKSSAFFTLAVVPTNS